MRGFELRCSYGANVGNVRVDGQSSWEHICAQLGALFDIPAGAPVLLTYKTVDDGAGRCCNTHCNTLQHTSAHCNALHHAGTHCTMLEHICNTRLLCAVDIRSR